MIKLSRLFSRTASSLLLLGGLTVAAAMGCGKPAGLDKVVVSGQVTLDGEPISNGEIRFIPTAGTVGPISGGPIKDGVYTAKGKGGVPLGTHQVEIRAYRASAKSQGQAGAGSGEGGAAEQYLDKRYNDQTTLTATIGADTEAQDFQLTSK